MKTIATELTAKQRLFCDEYLIDRNATAAALRAGYSAKTALGGHLMVIPKIKWYIEERTQATAKKLRVNHEMILDELCKIAFGNMGNFFGADGQLRPMNEIDADDKAALWSVSISDAGSGTSAEAVSTTKLRMYNKLSALDKIAKHLNFYKPELKLPEKEYIYWDDEALNQYDSFDDELFEQDEDEADEEEYDEEYDDEDVQEAPGDEAADEDNGEELRQDEEAALPEPVAGITEPAIAAEFDDRLKPYLSHALQPVGRFRGAIALPEHDLTDSEKLDASIIKELKLYGRRPQEYVNLSTNEKMRLLWQVRSFG